MGSVLHGSARTTPRVRAELQATRTSRTSTRALAARYGLNPKTVAKWRRRTVTADAPMGPRWRRSTALSPAEEAVVRGAAPHAAPALGKQPIRGPMSMRGSALVRDPEFEDRVVAETRALLSTFPA